MGTPVETVRVFYELFCEWGDDVADPVSDAPYRDALLALSRIARGSARSNALCVFAVVCIHDGLVPLATAALRVAYDNHPEHTLSRLMLAALNQGKSKELMDTQGSGVLCRSPRVVAPESPRVFDDGSQ